MKAKPNSHEKLEDFLTEEYVCIGWPGIGDLSQVSKDEIRNRFQKNYQYSSHSLGYSLGQVNAFVNTMKKGDIVLVKDNDTVHIGIVGDYRYEKQFDNDVDGLCHRRSVEWKKSVPFSKLKNDVQRFVNNRHTITKYPVEIEYENLEDLLYKNESRSITRDEKERVDSLFSEALDVLEDELKSEDPEYRLKAASELIRLKIMGGMKGY